MMVAIAHEDTVTSVLDAGRAAAVGERTVLSFPAHISPPAGEMGALRPFFSRRYA